ncbi:MAG: type VI secretion system baseplate subunit TssG [Planctomycetota bacterium]
MSEGASGEFIATALRFRLERGATRFRVDPSLAYPVAEAVDTVTDDGTPTLNIATFGLVGATGVMPSHYGEFIADREADDDKTLTTFLGMFQDRLAQLLLNAHIKYRYWLGCVWHGLGATDQPLGRAALALAGTRLGDVRESAGVPAETQILFAGLLARRPRSSMAIGRMIGDHFGVDVNVREFVGAWRDIPGDACLPLNAEDNGFAGARLGGDAILGDRYYDPAWRFRLELGPGSLRRLRDLLPGTPGAEALANFTGFAAGTHTDFEWTMSLEADKLPEARLTNDQGAPQRLGWTCWIHSGEPQDTAVAGPFHLGRIEAGSRLAEAQD